MKPYTIKEYQNSNKDPFGLTIKGKSRNFKEAHKSFQESIINGKHFAKKEVKFKVIDLSHNRGIKNAILQLSDGESKGGNVEDTNMDKNSTFWNQ